MTSTNYRPANIEFNVSNDDTNIPASLGNYDNAEAAINFLKKNFVAENMAITVNRHMDFYEKTELRKKYNDILENRMPLLEQDLRDAVQEYNDAKKAKELAFDYVTAYTNEAKQIAVDVKRALVPIQLDEDFTWRLPYKNRFYFFTYIDKSVRLVRISDMLDSDKTELFSQGKTNEEYFDNPLSLYLDEKKTN